VSLPADVRALVRLSACVAGGTEAAVRTACREAIAAKVPAVWAEETILQAYLLAGFPRALNAMREWRKASGATSGASGSGGSAGSSGGAPTERPITAADVDAWRAAGERTCATVYGDFYDKLRHNIADLHPALDDWMIVEGYGKILSRPGLDLPLRELCVVAACIATRQDRQLHSHLHGSLNAGATPLEVRATIDALKDLVDEASISHAEHLFAHIETSRQG
jgi:4-carboxymuconolactone decarboxylase